MAKAIMMSTCSGRFLVFVYWVYYVVVCLICYATAATQSTYLVGRKEVLNCDVNGHIGAAWDDTTNDPAVRLYSIDGNGNINEFDARKDNMKYQYYSADSGSEGQFSLNVDPATLTDVGAYTCVNIFDDMPIVEHIVKVEDVTDQVLITCDPCTGDSVVECQCTCSAVAGFPQSLSLSWTVSDQAIDPQPITQSKLDNSGTYNFESQTVVTIDQNDVLLDCFVDGYNNTEFIEENYASQVKAQEVLSSPVCELTLSAPELCTEVVLNCSCTGFPQPNEFVYIIDGTENITSAESTLRHDVEAETITIFQCYGLNGIKFGNSLSQQVSHPCSKSTTILPTTTSEPRPTPTTSFAFTTNSTTNNAQPTGSTTTTKKDNGTGTGNGGGGLSVGIIIVIIVVVIIVLILVGGFTFWMVSKRGCCEKCTEEKNAVTATTGDTTSSAPVYGVIDKSKKKKSDKTDGNGMPMSEAPEYAAVDKPLNSEPKPAPRSSQPPPNNSTEKQELQYADIDHSSRTPSNQIRQPAEAPTEYATVQSVIV